ncbi:hypothetical protein IMG5_086140 [Ichthyophthirius multifiliis]|uniref:Kelch motif family protein n=1 Tax=Ichthyophthirius multifiliis TaxID=5932 RepID=G0QQZ5_ICHMU|nr:hypothetical protein IMG5_086140 [Ichthyophthirius multifiliis]EGR32360.1 hypothetical protein IMG5_086140 [Ichthyophthirius multifiliis]|eukprot:XP_004035846.1 hypothetical protein IMG5_086140 [Ichthyophthirius multifiliis]
MSKNYIDTDVQMSFQKILATGYIPAPRNNHVSSFIQSRGLAFIHGGYDKKSEYNDAYTFNLKEKKWEKVKIQLKNPDSLRFVGHQSLHFPFDHCNNNVMMFGGWDGSKYTNQIIVINIQTNQVRQSNYSENVQSLDIGHQKNTKSTLEGKLFMQQDSPQKKQNVDNDLGLSNADQHEIQIKKLQQPNQLCPPGVRDHTLVYDYTKNQVVLFGGWDSFKFQFGCNEYNFLWTLDSSIFLAQINFIKNKMKRMELAQSKNFRRYTFRKKRSYMYFFIKSLQFNNFWRNSWIQQISKRFLLT